jgi:hypothetical protein
LRSCGVGFAICSFFPTQRWPKPTYSGWHQHITCQSHWLLASLYLCLALAENPRFQRGVLAQGEAFVDIIEINIIDTNTNFGW